MREAKHTPGPWKAIYSVGEWIIKCARGKYIGGLMIGGRECRANARLIAAAPDLLQALQDAVSTLEHEFGEGHGSARQFDAIIAKATGADRKSGET